MMTFYRGRIPNARRYLNSMTRICWPRSDGLYRGIRAPTLGKQSANIYALASKSTEHPETAAKARAEAIIEAHRLAFNRLMTPCTGQTARRFLCRRTLRSWRWS